MGKRKIWEKLLSSERLGAGKAPGTAERTAFQQDYDRIVFTSAFRRMKDKTQVFPLSKSDYVRTRLTHSLEVSQIARSVCRSLRLNEDLAEALALAPLMRTTIG